MGWKMKVLVALVGLMLLGAGLWPLGLLCFLYLVIPRGSKGAGGPRTDGRSVRRLRGRHIVGFGLVLLSGVALAAGGTLSPVVFFLSGVFILLWPVFGARLPVGEVNPVRDSVLLRSKYLPLAWHAVAELKPGAESFPRAASSFQGSLLVFTETGRAYVTASCFALSRKEAESKLLHQLRSSAPGGRAGAYLLPLDAAPAADLLRLKVSRSRLPKGDLADSASHVAGILLLECRRGLVRRAAAYEIDGRSPSASLPSVGAELESPPLVWEVLDSVGKRTSWPEPDPFSNLLDSLVATRGVPLGERLKAMEGAGRDLTVQSLAGEELRISRPQFRAIISIYS